MFSTTAMDGEVSGDSRRFVRSRGGNDPNGGLGGWVVLSLIRDLGAEKPPIATRTCHSCRKGGQRRAEATQEETEERRYKRTIP